MSHIGRHYDLEVDGRPTRIVFLGQEYGKALQCVDLEERYQMVSGYAQQDLRKRSVHMQGVTSTLRLLLGGDPGLDKEGEQLMHDGHIFDCFSLVNYLLCSALEQPRDPSQLGGGKGRSSLLMQRNCARHLGATLGILDPTVIVVHGKKVTEWMVKNQLLKGDNILERTRINGNWVDVLNFAHPSAGGNLGYWGRSTNSVYLKEIVAPQIKAYVHRQTSKY